MDGGDAERFKQVRPREALRFEYVDEQGWDTSCGYAALASLLRRYRGVDVDEAALLARGAPGAGATKVTLAELVRIARDCGLETRAWRADFGRLGELLVSAPLLVHYDRPQGHFALLLAAGPQGVVTADPARGLELLTRSQFLERWSGVVLEVLRPERPGEGAQTVAAAVRNAKGRSSLLERALSKPLGKQ